MRETPGRRTPGAAYAMGYSEEFLELLERRSAQSSAAYLLPHLRPGFRLLDIGCGPGTITVGLAGAVQPGVVHGIDSEGSQIEIAKAAAHSGEHDNMKLQTGDVKGLPFEDGYFDVVHCHAVLMHEPDTRAALAEVRRVLMPGGLFGCRELINASCFFEPGDDGLNGAWDTFADLLSANGGHPQMGRQLKRVLAESGFADIQVGAEFEYFVSDEDIAFFHRFATVWFCSGQIVDAAVSLGLARLEQFEGWRRALDRWKEAPGAVAAMGMGHALARSP